jgi:hypothetical protein
MPSPRPLVVILSRLFNRALARPVTRERWKLHNGLHVELYFDQTFNVHLCLWRAGDAPPSLGEWETVLDHWPARLPDPRPAPSGLYFTYNGWPAHGLAAHWLTPRPEAWREQLPPRSPGISGEIVTEENR